MLSVTIYFVILLINFGESVDFVLKNYEGGPIWIGIKPDKGKKLLAEGGLIINQGQEVVLEVDEEWSGKIWPRTWCSHTTRQCQTGDCNRRIECGGDDGKPPYTMAYINLKGEDSLDHYEVSLINGFNIPMSVSPQNPIKPTNSTVLFPNDAKVNYNCKSAECLSPLLDLCPGELKFLGGPVNNYVVGCRSPCHTFNTNQYCCKGAYSGSSKCKTEEWPTNYAEQFKLDCPDVITYRYDRKGGRYGCKAKSYLIAFGVKTGITAN